MIAKRDRVQRKWQLKHHQSRRSRQSKRFALKSKREIPQTGVSKLLGQAIGELLANEAMEFPVHIATLASNGCGFIARYVRGATAVFLAEYEEEPGMTLPIHSLVMDSSGYTARIILRERAKSRLKAPLVELLKPSATLL
jgi:hypothetical protein